MSIISSFIGEDMPVILKKYMKMVRRSGVIEDMGESNPDRYQYKDGKIEGHWDTPMEEDEYE